MLRDYLSGELSKGDLLHFKPKHLISMGNAFYCTCFGFPSLFREEEYLDTLIFQISAFTSNDLVEGSSSRHFIARDLQRGEAWPSRERID